MAILCNQLPLLRGLAPIHLANDAGASTAAQSSEMQGEAPPLLYPSGGKNYASW
jgi:hypothetical protein